MARAIPRLPRPPRPRGGRLLLRRRVPLRRAHGRPHRRDARAGTAGGVPPGHRAAARGDAPLRAAPPRAAPLAEAALAVRRARDALHARHAAQRLHPLLREERLGRDRGRCSWGSSRCCSCSTSTRASTGSGRWWSSGSTPSPSPATSPTCSRCWPEASGRGCSSSPPRLSFLPILLLVRLMARWGREPPARLPPGGGASGRGPGAAPGPVRLPAGAAGTAVGPLARGVAPGGARGLRVQAEPAPPGPLGRPLAQGRARLPRPARGPGLRLHPHLRPAQLPRSGARPLGEVGAGPRRPGPRATPSRSGSSEDGRRGSGDSPTSRTGRRGTGGSRSRPRTDGRLAGPASRSRRTRTPRSASSTC